MDPEEFRALAKKGLVIGAFFGLALLFYAMGWRSALVAYVIALAIIAILAILIQSGRGGGLAASLGGLGGDSLLGVHSATPIAKATYVMLALFIFILLLTARLRPPADEGQDLLGPVSPVAPVTREELPEVPAPAPPLAEGETSAPTETE